MQNVIKRSGQEVSFDITKIVNAVSKANDEVEPLHRLSQTQIEAIAHNCVKQIAESPHAVHVEDIQDMVETAIMEMRGYEVAQKYVRYRYRRELARKANTTDDAILTLLDRNNEEVKQENSNKNPIINSTQRDYMAGEVSKDLTRRLLLPEEIIKAHDEGIIHFHDADYFSQRETNCFSSKTRFVTSEGVTSFSKCKDGQHVTVLDKDGQWRDATVHYFGKQKLYDITLSSGRSQTVVTCTRDHRWILKNGTVTTNLLVGDMLYPLADSRTSCEMTTRDAEMWALGFVIGDGSDCGSGLRARLCGRKVDYLDTFIKAGYHVSHTYSNGDLNIACANGWSKRDFLACSFWKYLTGQDKKMIFKGLLAADGYANANAITSANPQVVEMIKDISAIAGYHVSSIKKYVHDTNYKKDATLYYVHFRSVQNSHNPWIVRSITEHHRNKQDVWCVVEPVTHSFTLDGGIVTGNCELLNLDDMLQNGTVISGTRIDKPHSFYTACNITTQIVAQVASNTYGGQSFTLSHLAPFVDISRKKIRKEVEDELADTDLLTDKVKIDEIVEKRLKNEIKAGIQTIQYQLITLMTCNGQAPFVTMFMYLDEVPEGQTRDDLAMIIEEALNQRIQGVKNEKGVWVTTAFPKIIYVLDEDNITEDSKYWYLTELSARCTAKRMVPDYVSAKVMKELKGDVYPPMGCVGGDEVIQYKIGDEYYTESFERAWDRLVSFGLAKNQPNGKDLYFDPTDVTIWDCNKKEFVPMKRIIKNRSKEWLHLTFSNGQTIDCTPDHPFETLQRGVVQAKDLDLEKDMILMDIEGPDFPEKAAVSRDLAHMLGYVCGCFGYESYDIFPTGIFVWDLESKKSFVRGYKTGVMSCPDPGPSKETRTLVRLLEKSIKKSEGTDYEGLATFTYPVKREEFYDPNKYSYDVTTGSEHFTVSGIYSHNCRSFLTADNEENAEGLCNAGNKSGALNYKEGQHKYYGRMNQGVVTINLVDVACSSNGDMDEFWKILDERLELCHKALRCRHERLLGTPSDVAPILWQFGAMARLKKGEPIDKLLYGNYSTISLGYAGLYEMCVRMTGKSHTSEEGHDFAIAVMQRLNNKCAEWRAAENISYSVYGTPLESTVYKFAKCLQKRFGMIPGVTDHNYITNSYHVNVREKIDAFTKLGFESEFQTLSPGGAISYVEVPNMQNNIPAVLAIMKYIYDHIMYAELNIKSDYCMKCGYDGEIRIIEDDNKKLIWECPNCGNRDQTKMQVARRTCGYIGTQYWNQGRTAEIRDRVLHVAQTALYGPDMNANATK